MKRVFYKFSENKKKTTRGNMRMTKGQSTKNNGITTFDTYEEYQAFNRL
jgi:hypothetical protein